jgi:hypothetical protein
LKKKKYNKEKFFLFALSADRQATGRMEERCQKNIF